MELSQTLITKSRRMASSGFNYQNPIVLRTRKCYTNNNVGYFTDNVIQSFNTLEYCYLLAEGK